MKVKTYLITFNLDQEKTSGSIARRLSFFFGCVLTVFVIVTLIIVYNRIRAQRYYRSSIYSSIRNRFHNALQFIGLNNLGKRRRFNFFSISNNNRTYVHNRQSEVSRAYLNENQDEALLSDDPHVDGGISSGIYGSSANPYKALTLSVT